MLHEFIRVHRQEILDTCLTNLKSHYPDRDAGELLNDLPQFLDDAAEALPEDAAGTADCILSRAGIAESHGALRKGQGFDLSRVVHDFGGGHPRASPPAPAKRPILSFVSILVAIFLLRGCTQERSN
jgi:hypothetical protein